MRPQDFITAAGKLAAIAQGDEALLRSAVSRAYYGAFHLALELLSAAGFDLPRNANAHVRCRRLLAGCGEPLAKEIAGALSDLHADRIKADYHLGGTRFRDLKQARFAVEVAHDAGRWIAECMQEPTRSRIAAGLKTGIERGL